jgi:hypothetical protein|tara:strand:- start:1790 stop:1993 length:204 start_codon:yes stop_codon:yes gene_type:complete
MSKVHIISGPGEDAPTPVSKLVIDGQGSIPYSTAVEEATPNIETGKMVSGKKKGMRAALRGGKFKSC